MLAKDMRFWSCLLHFSSFRFPGIFLPARHPWFHSGRRPEESSTGLSLFLPVLFPKVGMGTGVLFHLKPNSNAAVQGHRPFGPAAIGRTSDSPSTIGSTAIPLLWVPSFGGWQFPKDGKMGFSSQFTLRQMHRIPGGLAFSGMNVLKFPAACIACPYSGQKTPFASNAGHRPGGGPALRPVSPCGGRMLLMRWPMWTEDQEQDSSAPALTGLGQRHSPI